MKNLHIQAVDLVRDGLIVTYTDETRAFYDESVLMAHLDDTQTVPARKQPRSVSANGSVRIKESARQAQ